MLGRSGINVAELNSYMGAEAFVRFLAELYRLLELSARLNSESAFPSNTRVPLLADQREEWGRLYELQREELLRAVRDSESALAGLMPEAALVISTLEARKIYRLISSFALKLGLYILSLDEASFVRLVTGGFVEEVVISTSSGECYFHRRFTEDGETGVWEFSVSNALETQFPLDRVVAINDWLRDFRRQIIAWRAPNILALLEA